MVFVIINLKITDVVFQLKVSILSQFKVNVYVDNMFFEFGDKYSFYLELYKSKINGDKLINSLINDVKKVIESNRENYYKLKEFVDSL